MEARVEALRAKLGDLSSLCDDADALDAALKASQAAEVVAQQQCTDAQARATILEASLRTAEEAFYKRVADLELAWKNKVMCALSFVARELLSLYCLFLPAGIWITICMTVDLHHLADV
jgi:hypothetical protein